MNYGGRNLRNRTYAYIGTRKRCGACALKAQCTSGAFRFLAIHMDEPARQRARELASTPEFAKAQRERKKVEALFAELKISRIASLASAETTVCAGAVPSGGRGPEHQATGAVPQPTDKTHGESRFLTEGKEKPGSRDHHSRKTFRSWTFSTPTGD